MGKRKSFEKRHRAKQAENIAKGIVRRDNEVRALVRSVRLEGDPSGEKAARVKALRGEIEKKKANLNNLGVEVAAAINWVKLGRKAYVKGGGVGMHTLGPRLKVWN